MLSAQNAGQVEIRGYVPGAIGRITELHAVYYSQNWGLDVKFEAEVATQLSEFLLRFDPIYDGIWTAVLNGEIVGAIAIDGSSTKYEGARLRWFIIAPECQGYSIGKLLLQKAINFCKQAQLSQIHLWTFSGLSAARHIYEKFGFVLDEQHTDDAWGNTVTHQKFKLEL
jgi:GNAT superfamily N-acetyltransferase